MTEQTFVVVGASLAGAKAAEGMRDAGFEGRIVLVGDEHDRPYERPELSKGFLKGKKEAADLLVHEPGWYDENRVELRLGTAVAGIHRDEHEVELAGGERLGYDRLLLATGATPRRIEVPGGDLEGVRYLRRVGDAATLRQIFVGGGVRLVVVGGGWIGLEVAAAARGHGVEVTVVEPQPTPLYAVLGREVGQVFADLHRANGVDLRLGAGVASFSGEGGKVTAVTTDAGDDLAADLVVVGVGIRPNVALAEAAGLDVDNGVLVDALLASSDPDVFAAGDVANAEHPLYGARVRVEHWANALNQGKAAGRNMAGAGEPYVRVPYFYTDQYDLSMEYYGYTGREGHDRVVFRGEPVGGGEWLAFWLRDGRVRAAMNVNVWDQADALKKLTRDQTEVDPEALADPSVDLAGLAGSGG
jgi:3-phenylpropionate/trans-cinnamate dioxygenase ferredoxin reductase subunit